VEVDPEEAPLQELLANQLIGKPEVWLPESKINNNVVDAGPSPLLDVSDPEELLLDTHSLITLSNNSLIALDHMETMVAVVESWNLLSNTLRATHSRLLLSIHTKLQMAPAPTRILWEADPSLVTKESKPIALQQ